MVSTLASLTQTDADRILDRVIEFPDITSSFERIRPMTDFRKDDGEARILYICRRISSHSDTANGAPATDLYVVKIKVQVPSLLPGGQRDPIPGPSSTTAAEWKALKAFANINALYVPHLLAWKCIAQGPKGLFPTGYVSFTLMTLMPGQTLMDLKFWSMTEEQREEIRHAFLKAVKEIWRLGIAPYDCALRNILWEAETKRCSIVDFEHWYEANDPINMNETEEMQRWGMVRRAPPATWAAEWGGLGVSR